MPVKNRSILTVLTRELQKSLYNFQEIFIKEYLKHYHSNLSEDKNHEPSIDDINQLLCEVEAFTLATHLLWCLWSIVNASKSQIPFGYWVIHFTYHAIQAMNW